ncbi:hypothetical protein MPH_09657 [Macrophomina phaseolina MS6]|uniref:Uncharacterized protein n=2 Tax=Macrophomina phaseolina TaxID=35725 RepID=K2S8J5_MACPH|nr:hypothetical protein MPH_09657 [Macrophomina phaseolina MS6]KAH7034307.1 hypothetical protein B0J12DRAFT_276270 [Macrophomina phaseolina]
MGLWKNPFGTSSSESKDEPDHEAQSIPPPPPPPLPSPATSPPIEIAPAPPSRFDHARLSTPFEIRTVLAGTIAFFSGTALGMAHGSQAAGLRYRAENAHRLPTDATGWYLYHKSKNYHAMLGGVREGLRMGVKLSVWVSGFFMCEEAIDRARGLGDSRGDFGSTVVAGLGTAGAWSLWNRFPPITIARTARMGLAVGLGYGLLQDAVTLLRGQRLSYIEYFRNLPRRFEDRRQRNVQKALARCGNSDDNTQHT